MRTRSGSLAAFRARVPSHPAHSGVLSVFTTNASNASSITHTVPRDEPGRVLSRVYVSGRVQSTFSPHHRRWKLRIWLVFALSRYHRQLQHRAWRGNAGP